MRPTSLWLCSAVHTLGGAGAHVFNDQCHSRLRKGDSDYVTILGTAQESNHQRSQAEREVMWSCGTYRAGADTVCSVSCCNMHLHVSVFHLNGF